MGNPGQDAYSAQAMPGEPGPPGPDVCKIFCHKRLHFSAPVIESKTAQPINKKVAKKPSKT